MLDNATVEAADRAAREWKASGVDPILPGTDAHKIAFCRMLLDTHNRYKPAVIDWPLLDPETRDRLVALPIWDIAVQTEGKARERVLGYAQTIADPLLREAIELGGSSVSDYVDAEGREGFFQLQHRVYGREGRPCLVCRTPIKRVIIAGRSSHYCPHCQK